MRAVDLGHKKLIDPYGKYEHHQSQQISIHQLNDIRKGSCACIPVLPVDGDGIGGPVVRRVTAAPDAPRRGRMSLDERRPWQPAPALTSLTLDFDLTGPEQTGLSRAERRHLLEAA